MAQSFLGKYGRFSTNRLNRVFQLVKQEMGSEWLHFFFFKKPIYKNISPQGETDWARIIHPCLLFLFRHYLDKSGHHLSKFFFYKKSIYKNIERQTVYNSESTPRNWAGLIHPCLIFCSAHHPSTPLFRLILNFSCS